MRSKFSLLCEKLSYLRQKADKCEFLSVKEIATLRSENGKCLWNILVMVSSLSAKESEIWYQWFLLDKASRGALRYIGK